MKVNVQILIFCISLKFMFSKKATKIDEIFTSDLTVTTYCQIDGEEFVNFCGLLRKPELYQNLGGRIASMTPLLRRSCTKVQGPRGKNTAD